MNDLQIYLNSLEEGDNITVTADLLMAMEEALMHRDEFYKQQIREYIFMKFEDKEMRDKFTDEIIEEIAHNVENDDSLWEALASSIDWFVSKKLNEFDK